jgi:hypothetical protein
MDAIRNRTAKGSRSVDARHAWSVASPATQVPDGFPSGSHRVPAAAQVSPTEIRVPWRGARLPRLGEELKRDRLRTEEEPLSLRIKPNGD